MHFVTFVAARVNSYAQSKVQRTTHDYCNVLSDSGKPLITTNDNEKKQKKFQRIQNSMNYRLAHYAVNDANEYIRAG